MDQDDTLVRHLLESGKFDTDGQRHSAKLAWRALAILQLEIEADQAKQEVAGEKDDERNADERNGEECCARSVQNQTSNYVYVCTRVRGHKGRHIARGADGRVYATQEAA